MKSENKMIFEVTGSKARPGEADMDLQTLLYGSKRSIRMRQRKRVLHATSWSNASPLRGIKDGYTHAIIEIEGVYAN